MCGIAGIHGLEYVADPEALVRRMTDAIAHRGPDATGVSRAGNCVLGHRRLSIIDLSSDSNQPFTSIDGRFTVAYNGEIYNYRELKAELTDWTWRTGSDTEVLLAAFSKWGAACLDRLHGMFAFAIHDASTDELFIARDRMGIKPLYWYSKNGVLMFASEIRALLATGLGPRKLDRDSVVDHVRYQTVHAPATIVQDVYMLKAGHCIRISGDEVKVQRWYSLVDHVDASAGELPLNDVHRTIKELLSRAVEKRLVSDVPFGAFLSGGIDSTAVVGLMAQASTKPVHTFSVVFDEAEFSEERYARIVADKFGTKHTTIRLVPEDMLRMLPDALAAMDHPSADGPNTFVVSKVTKAAGITMALSGLGGDEVFAGYPVFTRTLGLQRKRWLSRIPSGVRQLVADAIVRLRPSIRSNKLGELLRLPDLGVEHTYPVSRLGSTAPELQRLFGNAELPFNRVAAGLHSLLHHHHGNSLPILSQVSIGELDSYLQDVLLRDTDQMSMAHALEVRVPFLDHELVEFVLGVPDHQKYPHTPKKLLVDSLGDLLPKEIVDRPKMGFTLPWELWMRKELKSFCEDRVRKLDARGIFVNGAIGEMWQAFVQRDPQVNWARLWSLVVLEDWLERNAID